MTKRLEIKPFLNSETVGFILLSPAIPLPQYDAFVGLKRFGEPFED
jgi:hypothetical protein